MESWHLPYDAIMSMPTTRRQRLLKKKLELEQKREDAQRQQAANSRSRMRR
jgi:hypothetical protein